RRYHRIAEAAVGATVLLLTATPVVNRTADRTALLALFLGDRAERLSAEALGRCIVRRPTLRVGRPAVRRLPPLAGASDLPGLGAALAALPPPLPMAGPSGADADGDGRGATALVRMSLAMAWRSSLAALDHALRRRVQLGEAILDLLRAGRPPTRAALAAWVLDDDATQLAMGALLGHGPTIGRDDDACRVVAWHLAAVRALRDRVTSHVAHDTERRAEALRGLLRDHPGTRVVLFARSTVTVRALHAALRTEHGVVALTGDRVRSAAGRWTRGEVLRAVGPSAPPWRADDPRQIRLVLASDVLAEGIEMPGVGILVHADLPWTPARIEQREGRIRRAGTAQHAVLETRFAPPRGVRPLLQLGARLRGKDRARRRAVADAAHRSFIQARLRAWALDADAASPGVRPRIATVIGTDRVPARRFIAVLRDTGGMRLCVGRRIARGWEVSERPHTVAATLHAAEGPSHHTNPALVRAIRGVLVRHARRCAVHIATTDGGAAPEVLARVRARLTRRLAATPPLERRQAAERQARWLALLGDRVEAARAARLRSLLRLPDDEHFGEALDALVADRARPTDGAAARHSDSRSDDAPAVRLVALLVLTPPSASSRPEATGATPVAAPRPGVPPRDARRSAALR
ncbi:MAG: hypothetical protein RL139_1301, partial [Gemmatimonadota bacterium]